MYIIIHYFRRNVNVFLSQMKKKFFQSLVPIEESEYASPPRPILIGSSKGEMRKTSLERSSMKSRPECGGLFIG